MSTKVIFSNRDEILGAIIRALAVQVAGFQVAKGMNGDVISKIMDFMSSPLLRNKPVDLSGQ